MEVYRWFRWHHGAVGDPKMRMVATQAETTVANVVAVWACLLEAASEHPDRGCLADFDNDVCAFTLGIDDAVLMRIKSAMRDRGMLLDDRVVAWEKRQPKREDETAKERKARERERKASINGTSNGHATSRDGTQRHTSIHIVTPREEEIREEKNLRFDQSAASKPPTRRRRSSAQPTDSLFDEFWTAYPRKVGKAVARVAWKRAAASTDPAAIIAGATQAAAAWKAAGTEPAFIPHPTTWLRAERWADEIPTPPKPKPTSGYGHGW